VNVQVHELPEGYSPDDDRGRLVVEMFIDHENPPNALHIEKRDSDERWIVIAEWESTEEIRQQQWRDADAR
jgi:hypothetical protein